MVEGGLWWFTLNSQDQTEMEAPFKDLLEAAAFEETTNNPLIIHPVRFSASFKKGLKKLRWTGKIFGFYNNILLIRILTKINYKVEYILWKFNIGTSRTSKNNCIFFDIWSNLNNFITGLSLKKKKNEMWHAALSLSFKKTQTSLSVKSTRDFFHTQECLFFELR